jgi:hypothetical protein
MCSAARLIYQARRISKLLGLPVGFEFKTGGDRDYISNQNEA